MRRYLGFDVPNRSRREITHKGARYRLRGRGISARSARA
jgi:hypothetical protein